MYQPRKTKRELVKTKTTSISNFILREMDKESQSLTSVTDYGYRLQSSVRLFPTKV